MLNHNWISELNPAFPDPTLEGIFKGFLETFVFRDRQCLELNKALSLGAAPAS